jgi:hypothetical protein
MHSTTVAPDTSPSEPTGAASTNTRADVARTPVEKRENSSPAETVPAVSREQQQTAQTGAFESNPICRRARRCPCSLEIASAAARRITSARRAVMARKKGATYGIVTLGIDHVDRPSAPLLLFSTRQRHIDELTGASATNRKHALDGRVLTECTSKVLLYETCIRQVHLMRVTTSSSRPRRPRCCLVFRRAARYGATVEIFPDRGRNLPHPCLP